MLKTLIASTFLTAALAFPVMAAGTDTGAANTTGATPAAPAMTAPADMKATPDAPKPATSAAADTSVNVGADMMQASAIIGTSVTDAKGDSIGEVGDILLNKDGQVGSYVVNVGGFLGIGDKPVALSPSEVTISADANGSLKANTTLTKDQLTAHAEYKKPEVPAAAAPAATGTTPGAAPGAPSAVPDSGAATVK